MRAREFLGGGCQSGLTVGGYIDLALGFDTEGYDVTLTIGYPFSLHSSFFFLSLRYSKRRLASWTHKPGSCTYTPASSSHLFFSAILFRSLLRHPPRFLCNERPALASTHPRLFFASMDSVRSPPPLPLPPFFPSHRDQKPPLSLKNKRATKPHHLRFFLYH